MRACASFDTMCSCMASSTEPEAHIELRQTQWWVAQSHAESAGEGYFHTWDTVGVFDLRAAAHPFLD